MSTLRSYVELKVAALELRGRRIDPFAVLKRAPTIQLPDPPELGRSEIVWGDTNPAFVQSFEIPIDNPNNLSADYRIYIYNKNSRSDELRKNSIIGFAELSIDRVFDKTDGVIKRLLKDKNGKRESNKGTLIICGEKVTVADNKHMFSIQFGFGSHSECWGPGVGRKAKRVFYVIYRAIINGISDEDWTPVYRSEILDPYPQRNRDIMFEGASIPAEHLYGMDENRALRFEIFHYSNSGPHIPLGFVQTSASAFKFARPGGKLYMVPTLGSTMKTAHVMLDMAKIGLTTRRGGVSSVFCLRATGFTWGEPGEGNLGDDYLERDAYGRTGLAVAPEAPRMMPRGVSYMKSRLDMGVDDTSKDEKNTQQKQSENSVPSQTAAG